MFSTLRVVLAALTLLTLLLFPITMIGIHSIPPPEGTTLDVYGCDPVQIQRLPGSAGTVLQVTTTGCRGSTRPTSYLARAVWNQTYDIAEMRIRMTGPASPLTVLPRAELERRYGPRHRPEHHASDLLWLLLPLTLIVPVTFAVLVLRRAAHSGAVLVVVHRR